MATESIGQTVYLTDEMADRIIEAMEKVRTNPPKPRTNKARLATPEEHAELTALLKKQYGDEDPSGYYKMFKPLPELD